MSQTTFQQQLINRYVNNTATAEELEVIDHLMAKGELDELLILHMQESWDMEAAVYDVQPSVPLRTFKLWRRIAAVAATITAISLCIWFYNVYNSGGISNQNDIAPGKNGATLTLANGQKIYIAAALTGKLAEQAGVSITKTGDGQIVYEIKEAHGKTPEYNVLQTSNGEQSQIILPDKSKVFLNAASSIKFPSSFAGLKERKIELNGEAYFEISKDAAHPFIVKTIMQELKVLGTHFNISSYGDEDAVKTTLLEGSVRITTGAISVVPVAPKVKPAVREITLKPGQQSSVAKGQINVYEVDTEEAIAWKNGDFMFNNEPLESVMRKVSRWYDVEVVYQDGLTKNSVFYGTISRFNQVSKVLRMLELTREVRFKIEGKKVTVMSR